MCWMSVKIVERRVGISYAGQTSGQGNPELSISLLVHTWINTEAYRLIAFNFAV